VLNVVLINPEIPFNTGNIGRTCAATGSFLHLTGKLGFKINDREIRRSGLDYWPKLQWRHYPSFEDYIAAAGPSANLLFFSTKGEKNFWDAPYSDNCSLIFGGESTGFPPEYREKYRERMHRIPIREDMRSLNLSSSAAVAIYEALRQIKGADRPLALP
jgi:tRNA (cytidine/uridine-2'-O-)-methyltransferase